MFEVFERDPSLTQYRAADRTRSCWVLNTRKMLLNFKSMHVNKSILTVCSLNRVS